MENRSRRIRDSRCWVCWVMSWARRCNTAWVSRFRRLRAHRGDGSLGAWTGWRMQCCSIIRTIARIAIRSAIGAFGTQDFMPTPDMVAGIQDSDEEECAARVGVAADTVAGRGIPFRGATVSREIARDGIRLRGETLSPEITGGGAPKVFRISAARETAEALAETMGVDLAIGARTGAQRMLRTSLAGRIGISGRVVTGTRISGKMRVPVGGAIQDRPTGGVETRDALG